MKTVKNTKTPKATKATPAVTEISKKLADALATPAPVAAAPVAPKPVATAPVIGEADATSRRLTPGTALTVYRVVPSQRKSFKGYYLQGGNYRKDPINGRDLFDVAVEIPHTDLAAARTHLAALRAAAAKVA